MSFALTALGVTLLELEELSEGAVMNVGGVMVFDALPEGGVPSVEEVQALVGDRLSALHGYRHRLSRPRTGGWSWPEWVTDDGFDIANHVRRAALARPGGDAELCDWIADFYSHRLDRTRPLWEIVVLEGLEHGRWALAPKLHHCLIDETGSVGASELLLDAEPRPPETPSSWSAAVEPEPLWRSLVPSAPRPLAQSARAGGHVVMSGMKATLRPHQTLARSRMLAELLIEDEMVGAPACSLNVPIGSTRRYAVVRRPLADLTAISHALGGPVSDVALAACTSGLRRLLLERDEDLPPEGLRAMFPLNLRDAQDSVPVGFRFVSLPVAEPAAVVRHEQLLKATRRNGGSAGWEATGTLVDLAALAPPLVHASLARVLYRSRLFNLTIASVRGAQRPRYAFGALLREVHPITPLAAEHAVGITVFSQDGLTIFGISADSESMPDLPVLALGIEEGIEDLMRSVHGDDLGPSSRSGSMGGNIQNPSSTSVPGR
jgi:diacylglycerol O-acyltransferase / wax synthase